MRKKQTTPTNYTDYIENQYDDMRDMLKKSRMLVEQEGGSMTTDIDVGKKRLYRTSFRTGRLPTYKSIPKQC